MAREKHCCDAIAIKRLLISFDIGAVHEEDEGAGIHYLKTRQKTS